MRSVIVMVVAAALLGAGGYGLWRFREGVTRTAAGGAAGQPAAMAIPVEASPVRVGPIAEEITAVGSLRSNETVMIRPEIAGRVARIAFEEGRPVKAGEVLVMLDDSVPRAELADAQAKETLARANAARAEELYGRGAGSARARDEAHATLLTARAAVELMRARLEKHALLAPFDGIAGLRQVSPGGYVAEGAAIVNVESIDPIKVDFRVPELYLRALRPGQTLRVRVDAWPGEDFTGEVYAIDPAVDTAGRAIAIRARMPNPDGRLRPGLFARVTLALRSADTAILVPENAIVPVAQGAIVMKIVDGRAQPQPVRLGIRRGAEVQVTEGLAAGDVVVTAGHMKLQPGAPVMIAGERPAAPPAPPRG